MIFLKVSRKSRWHAEDRNKMFANFDAVSLGRTDMQVSQKSKPSRSSEPEEQWDAWEFTSQPGHFEHSIRVEKNLSSCCGSCHCVLRICWNKRDQQQKKIRPLRRTDQGATYAVQLGWCSFVQIAAKDFAHAAQSSRALRARRFSANLRCVEMHSAPLMKITNASRLRPCESTQQAA